MQGHNTDFGQHDAAFAWTVVTKRPPVVSVYDQESPGTFQYDPVTQMSLSASPSMSRTYTDKSSTIFSDTDSQWDDGK